MTKLWRERIAEAKANDGFTLADKRDCETWHTCKVGERFASDPTYSREEMRHLGAGEAYGLGIAFDRAVHDDDFDKAAELCAAIDKLTDWRKEA